MKKLLFAMSAVAAMCAFAHAEEAEKAETGTTNDQSLISFWGFGNYGLYSGYQLYGSLVNDNPTLQGYIDLNVNIGDLGYIGFGLWSNTDLTPRRRDNELGQAFNEYDPNFHFGRTFWFDDDKTWGLDWRSTFVWFYYPPKNYKDARVTNHTTWDFDHSFALLNPYVVPYVTVVREYSKGANLVVFGLKKDVALTDELHITPYIEGVWREAQYNWCFPTGFGSYENDPYAGEGLENKNSGIATAKIGFDLNYQFSEHFGLFAKLAYCCVVDPDLRDNCDAIRSMPYSWYSYGSRKDFAWGAIGVSFNF